MIPTTNLFKFGLVRKDHVVYWLKGRKERGKIERLGGSYFFFARAKSGFFVSIPYLLISTVQLIQFGLTRIGL